MGRGPRFQTFVVFSRRRGDKSRCTPGKGAAAPFCPGEGAGQGAEGCAQGVVDYVVGLRLAQGQEVLADLNSGAEGGKGRSRQEKPFGDRPALGQQLPGQEPCGVEQNRVHKALPEKLPLPQGKGRVIGVKGRENGRRTGPAPPPQGAQEDD